MNIFSHCFSSSSSSVQEIYIPAPTPPEDFFNPDKLLSLPSALLALIFTQDPQPFFTTLPLLSRKWSQIHLPSIIKLAFNILHPSVRQFYLLQKMAHPRINPKKSNFQEVDFLKNTIAQSIQKYPIPSIDSYRLRIQYIGDSINKDWIHLYNLFKLRTAPLPTPTFSWLNVFSCCISNSSPANPYQEVQELYDKAIKIHQITYCSIVQNRISNSSTLLNCLISRLGDKDCYNIYKTEWTAPEYDRFKAPIEEITISLPLTYLPNIFCTLPLRELNCSGAKLNNLPKAISQLTELTYLDLRGNNISDLRPILTLTSLTDLDISDNPCTSSPELREQARSQLANLRLTTLNL